MHGPVAPTIYKDLDPSGLILILTIVIVIVIRRVESRPGPVKQVSIDILHGKISTYNTTYMVQIKYQ